jgi:hypothetical protein
MPIIMHLDGSSQVLAHVEKMKRAAPHMAQIAIAEALQPVWDESQRLVPVDTSALKQSGVFNRGGDVIEMSYGNYATPYAWIVHERMDVHHDPPTQAKFLEQPFRAALPTLTATIARRMKEMGFVNK